jgi:hypothetical protein
VKLPPSSGRLLLLLALLSAAVRWLSRVHRIYGWDSVHYVLAQDRYDILAHQPHPPGSYYYVLLARAARLLTGDPHTSLLLVSSLLGGLLVWVLYHLARDLRESEAAGWIAAVLGATSPLLWFYGSVGLNYGPSGTLSALVALGCVRACRPRSAARGLLVTGVALGVLGGFRPTDVAFLAPACLWALACAWRSGVRGWSLLAGPAAAALLTAGWLTPNLINTGGFAGYLNALRGQEHLLSRSSVLLAGWPALLDAAITHQRSLESLLGAGWLLVLVGAARVVWCSRIPGFSSSRTREILDPNRNPDLRPFQPLPVLGALIVAPAFLFYLLGHFNSPGYALSYGGFVLAVGAGICATAVRGKRVLPVALACLAMGNTALFCLGWPGARRLGQRSLSAVELRDHDRYYETLEGYLRRHYPPGQVRILSSWTSTDGLRIAQALLPEYAADVAQAVDHVPELPALFSSLHWLRLLTPATIRAEGRPVLAIYRTREDPGYHESLFPHQWEKVPIGSGYLIYRLRK